MFIETNPIPIKAATTMVTGIECGEPRLPLTPLEAQHKEQLAAMLKEYGLMK